MKDTSYQDKIICPYCYEVNDDQELDIREEGVNLFCTHCDKEFFLSIHITIRFTTSAE
jgi:uncharacterized Zn-finger protein